MSRSVDSSKSRKPWGKTVKLLGSRRRRRQIRHALRDSVLPEEEILPTKKVHAVDVWGWD